MFQRNLVRYGTDGLFELAKVQAYPDLSELLPFGQVLSLGLIQV